MKNQQTQPKLNPGAGRFAVRLGAIAIALALAGIAQAQVFTFTNVWGIPAATYLDLPGTNNNVRGVALSPLTTNVLYASTTGGTNGSTVNHIAVLDANNGSNYLAQLNSTGVSGGIVTLMNVRVSEDGSVYASNRRDGGVNTFTIYRWPSESDLVTPAVKIVDQAFVQRLGDHMDVRGSGTNTEIVVIGSGASGAAVSTNFFIFRPTDDTLTVFTNFNITIPGNTASSIVSAHGVTFEGTNNAIYVLGGSPLAIRRIQYDPVALTAIATRTNAVDSANCRALKYYSPSNGVVLLSSVQMSTASAAAQVARIFQQPTGLTNAMISVLSSNFPTPYTGATNGNGLGQVDANNGRFVFGAPNYGITVFQVASVYLGPVVSGISGGGVYLEGQNVTLSSSVTGVAPLSYQWYFNTNTPIVGATTNSLALLPAQIADSGIYSLVVSNPFAVVTSSFAGLTVLPGNFSNFATNIWTLAPGSRPYLTTGDTQRGLAYDAVSNVVLVVSRSPSNVVALLNGNTGAEVGVLDLSLFNPPTGLPGFFPINTIGVAGDGAVYLANLIISGSDSFALYRFQNADPTIPPTQAYLGNPGVTRLGDTISVRGGGVNTEILCSQRTGSNVVLFTTADGVSFNATLISVTNLPPDAVTGGFAGLGVAFGNGNTFWAKSSNFRLRRVAYDASAGTGEVIETYDSLTLSEAPLGVDNVNGYVAAVAFGQNPQNLSIWDVSQGPPNAVQLDRELFGSNNANGNGTGAVAFDVNGGRIFALNSNNGIIALAYAPRLTINPTPAGGIVTWTGPGTLQASTNLASGVWTDLPSATSPHTNTAAKEVFFRVKR